MHFHLQIGAILSKMFYCLILILKCRFLLNVIGTMGLGKHTKKHRNTPKTPKKLKTPKKRRNFHWNHTLSYESPVYKQQTDRQTWTDNNWGLVISNAVTKQWRKRPTITQSEHHFRDMKLTAANLMHSKNWYIEDQAVKSRQHSNWMKLHHIALVWQYCFMLCNNGYWPGSQSVGYRYCKLWHRGTLDTASDS